MRPTTLLLLAAVIFAVTGCGASDGVPLPKSDTISPRADHNSGGHDNAETPPAEFAALYVESEPFIGSLSSVRGTDQLGPFPTRTGRIALYLRCWGDGILSVEIENSAAFTQRCLRNGDDPGTRNTLDIAGDTIRVTGSADDADVWALAITEIPPR